MVPGKPGGFAPPFFFFLRKRMRRARWKKKSLFAAQLAAGQLAEMRGSSESVPAKPAGLLPSAEYIGCCRDCSAAARRTPAAIVGWKIARSVLLAPRIPLRYALPAGYRKHIAKPSATARVRQQKRSRGNPGAAPSTDLPQLPMCGSKRGAEGHPGIPPIFATTICG